MPSFIVLAHESIHALHEIWSLSSRTLDPYEQGNPGKSESQMSLEELFTIHGTEELPSGKGRQVPCCNQIDNSPYLPVQNLQHLRFCENTFLKEFGLPERIDFISPTFPPVSPSFDISQIHTKNSLGISWITNVVLGSAIGEIEKLISLKKTGNEYWKEDIWFQAAYFGKVDVLEYLLNERVKPFCTSSQGVHAVHLAASCDSISALQFLIEKAGIDPVQRDRKKRTPLHYAAEVGKTEAVKFLLNKSEKILEMASKDNKTALDLAVEKGHLETIEALLEQGARITRKSLEMLRSLSHEKGEDIQRLFKKHLSSSSRKRALRSSSAQSRSFRTY